MIAATKRLSLLCNDSGYISTSVEGCIYDTCEKLGFSNASTKKEIAILNNERAIAYISRKTGLSKGVMHIVIEPQNASKMDLIIEDMACIKINPNKRNSSRFISSSNYRDFNSIGFCQLLKSNEPAAAGYIIDAEDCISELKSFLLKLNGLKRLQQSIKS
ncbi:hypothetical protein [Shewanella gaetbuli]